MASGQRWLGGEFYVMPLTIHPKVGQIVVCDFSTGFKQPEMVKAKRPVIVISPPNNCRPELTTIVALSTVEPDPVMPYNMKLPKRALPMLGKFQEKDSWVKGDMIYAVGFHRLDLIKVGGRHPVSGKRHYFKRTLSRETMKQVYRCVLESLNIGQVADYL